MGSGLRRACLPHRAKFCRYRLNGSGYITTLAVFKIAAVRHLGFVGHVFGPATTRRRLNGLYSLIFVVVQNSGSIAYLGRDVVGSTAEGPGGAVAHDVLYNQAQLSLLPSAGPPPDGWSVRTRCSQQPGPTQPPPLSGATSSWVARSPTMFSLHMPKSAILMCPSASNITLSSFRSLRRTKHRSIRPSVSSSLRINRSLHPACFPFVSVINSRLLSVNHALISPVRTHLVLRVALLPSVPSTHHSHHSSPPQSFIPGLIPVFPFLQILPTVTFLFFFQD